MNLGRRGFLTGLLAAPYIVRNSGVLMPIRPQLVLAQTIDLGIYTGGCVPFFITPQGHTKLNPAAAEKARIDRALAACFRRTQLV